jgi:hypothetical protein
MLDDQEFDAVWQAWQAKLEVRRAQTRGRQATPVSATLVEHAFGPLREAYELTTGLKFDGENPKVIMHYRTSFYGPHCPYCGRLLRNQRARQCFECGMDWHDPQNVICHRHGGNEGR